MHRQRLPPTQCMSLWCGAVGGEKVGEVGEIGVLGGEVEGEEDESKSNSITRNKLRTQAQS